MGFITSITKTTPKPLQKELLIATINHNLNVDMYMYIYIYTANLGDGGQN